MAQVRGYPNPNYTEQDLLPPVDLTAAVSIDDKEYRELCQKAAAFDILTSDIKSKIDTGVSDYNLVNDSVVLAVTGMAAYKRQKDMESKGKAEDEE